MRLPSRGNIHVTLPGAQHRDREMCRRAETKQPDALARFDTRNPQASEANDAGAQQRRSVQIVERCG